MSLNLAPSSLHSALQMDPAQHQQQPSQQDQLQQAQPPQQTASPQQTTTKKRKKNDSSTDDAQSPSEPRRLRRSHEACARCRSKKIKCDSKHPRCTACATAGTPCHQEDRHRQTLTPRGHTERIEHQLAQCEALLKRHIPGFDLNNLDDILAREGIDITVVNPQQATPAFQFAQPTTSRPFRPDGGLAAPLPGAQGPKYPYPPPQHMVPPGYPHPIPLYGAPPPGSPYPHPPPPMMQMPGPPTPYNPHIHPAFQQHPPPQIHTQPQSQQPQSQPAQQSIPNDIKGQDPQSNDMSNTQSLAKNFGVSPAIVNDLKLGPGPVDKEDLAVGSSGLTSGRDRDIHETSTPRDTAKWVTISVRRNSSSNNPPNSLAISFSSSNAPSVDVWLPKDRKMVKDIIEIYFTRLNHHRPVFERKDFEKVLDDLYEGRTVSHDPGYVCSLYLVLALGTLSELNHRAVKMDTKDGAETGAHIGPILAKKLMPPDWPEHDEFFDRALSVKPDLRVTISSLQALILLQWYLYTERQGRTLWRLVGSLVRLSIELGLHHDPTTQANTFTDEECQLRIRLWGIVMVHDRGTSILLGRPLAIAPSDSNTPHPIRPKNANLSDFSEHFELSHPVADIQADIINSLYAPKRQSGDAIMRSATRIIKRMLEFRRGLPESYRYYFSGTDDWLLDRKSKLVQEITEDQGLTLLKTGISRILLLRALFSSKELSYAHRHKALVDAIVTSHNIIIVHNQLIKFPDIAFFTSPIPLHIAAMVILYGHMSRCERLPKQVALEDVWLALDMLPRFRWRWERKDFNGGHPLIAKLAERVMDVNLHQVGPASHPVLLSEPEWEDDVDMSPTAKSQQSTPTLSSASYNGSVVYGPHPRATPGNASANVNGSGSGTPPDKHLVDVPTGLFYPFYPEAQVFPMPAPHVVDSTSGSGTGSNGNQHQDYTNLLAAAAAQPDGSYGCQPSHDSFMSEERDTSHQHQHGVQMWMNVPPGQRGGLQTYAIPPQT